jgi:surface antigen
MRSIPTLAFVTGLAVCQLGTNETAVAAASDPPQQVQTTSQAECGAVAPATSSGTVDHSAVPTCQPDTSWHLVQRRPGFWIAENVGSGSPWNVPDPPAVLRAADSSAPAGAPACQSYPLPVVVGGRPQQATVVACPQADGSWQVTQYTPGLPPQVYIVPPPPTAGASSNDYASPGDYQDWGPDWGGGPWFWGFAPAIVVVQRFHFFHGFNHGFAHGFNHGFAHGFSHGFAHGFAGGHGGFGGGGFGGMHRRY